MIIYTVKKGDSLWKIARRYNISLEALIAANPEISDPNYILVGQQVNVPEIWQPAPPPVEDIPLPDNDGANGSLGIVQRQPNNTYVPNFPDCSEDPSARPCIYVAHQGDTLEMIGQIFMTPLTRLLYYNLRYAKDEELPEGARVVIPENEILPLTPTRRSQPRRR